MFWQLNIPKENSEDVSASITVEADNWFSALKEGLEKHGVDGKLISNLSCNIQADQSVKVTDFVTRRTYTLQPVDQPSGPGQPDASATAQHVPIAISDDFAPHTIFFGRDEAPDDGSGIFYRERLIAVEQGFKRDEAGRLIHAYFKQLKTLGSDEGTKLFISVQIFDHEFKDQSLKPAVAALTWREWSPKKPKVLFPLSGDDGVTFSKLPPPPSPPQKKADPQPVHAVTYEELDGEKEAQDSSEPQKPIPQAPKADEVKAEVALDKPEVDKAAEETKVEAPVDKPEVDKAAEETKVEAPVDKPSEPSSQVPLESKPAEKASKPARELVHTPHERPKRKAFNRKYALTPPPKDISTGDKMVQAFERMQDIYDVRDHDGSAKFVLSLLLDLIDCEGGRIMLMTPGKYKLYVAAVHGPRSDLLNQIEPSLRNGIVGFSTRTSSVVNVSDPSSDTRFGEEFDEIAGYEANNVLCAPVQLEGQTLGAIEIMNSPRTAGFTQGESNIVSYLGSALAEYIENSLPSREADFQDRDFLDHAGQAPASMRQGVARVAKSVSSRSTPVSSEKPKENAQQRTKQGVKKRKVKKKRKRRR